MKTLDEEWEKYLGAEPSPYSFVVHEKPDTGDYTIYIELRKPPSPLLSVIVGDVLHNLRSAFDHFAWELVKLAGGKPGRHTYFPFCDTEADWMREVEHRRRSNDRKSPLDGIEPGSPIWLFIQAVQPYKRAVYARAMRDLRTLSNADKHRSLLISGVFPEPDDFAAIIKSNPDAVLRRQEIHLEPNQPVKDGDKVASLNFDPAKPNPHLEVKGELGIKVAFSDGKWDGSRSALVDLKAALGQYLEYSTGLFLDPPQFEDPAQLADLMASEFD